MNNAIPYAFKVATSKDGEARVDDFINAINDVKEQVFENLRLNTFNYRRLPALYCGGMQFNSIQSSIGEFYQNNGIFLAWDKQKPYRVTVFIPEQIQHLEQEIKQVVKNKLRFPLRLIAITIYVNQRVFTDDSVNLMTSDNAEITIEQVFNSNPN